MKERLAFTEIHPWKERKCSTVRKSVLITSVWMHADTVARFGLIALTCASTDTPHFGSLNTPETWEWIGINFYAMVLVGWQSADFVKSFENAVMRWLRNFRLANVAKVSMVRDPKIENVVRRNFLWLCGTLKIFKLRSAKFFGSVKCLARLGTLAVAKCCWGYTWWSTNVALTPKFGARPWNWKRRSAKFGFGLHWLGRRKNALGFPKLVGQKWLSGKVPLKSNCARKSVPTS
jgi:hypothetical protein